MMGWLPGIEWKTTRAMRAATARMGAITPGLSSTLQAKTVLPPGSTDKAVFVFRSQDCWMAPRTRALAPGFSFPPLLADRLSPRETDGRAWIPSVRELIPLRLRILHLHRC